MFHKSVFPVLILPVRPGCPIPCYRPPSHQCQSVTRLLYFSVFPLHRKCYVEANYDSWISHFPQKHGFFCIGSPKSHVDELVAEDSSRPSVSFIRCRPLP